MIFQIHLSTHDQQLQSRASIFLSQNHSSLGVEFFRREELMQHPHEPSDGDVTTSLLRKLFKSKRSLFVNNLFTSWNILDLEFEI